MPEPTQRTLFWEDGTPAIQPGGPGESLRSPAEAPPNYSTILVAPGTVHNGITAREYLGKNLWRVECPCGRMFEANATSLRKNRIARCPECRKPPETAPQTKACTVCGVEYPFTAEFFHHNNQFRFGLKARCKKCVLPKASADARERLKALRYEVLSHYSGGGKPHCICCLTDIPEFLALDHLEGSSRADYAKFGTSLKLFAHIKREGFKLRAEVRCHNCNEAIGHRGACPHHPDIARPVLCGRGRKKNEPAVPANHVGVWQTCIHCRRPLPLTADFYHRNKPMPTGFTTICKVCDNVRRSESSAIERASIRLEVLRHYSRGTMRCECCSEAHHEFLTIDHINGDGQKHREEAGGPLYRYLKKHGFPEDPPLRILCYNCNFCVGWFKVCVHQR